MDAPNFPDQFSLPALSSNYVWLNEVYAPKCSHVAVILLGDPGADSFWKTAPKGNSTKMLLSYNPKCNIKATFHLNKSQTQIFISALSRHSCMRQCMPACTAVWKVDL